jgi:hypothetical protein
MPKHDELLATFEPQYCDCRLQNFRHFRTFYGTMCKLWGLSHHHEAQSAGYYILSQNFACNIEDHMPSSQHLSYQRNFDFLSSDLS